MRRVRFCTLSYLRNTKRQQLSSRAAKLHRKMRQVPLTCTNRKSEKGWSTCESLAGLLRFHFVFPFCWLPFVSCESPPILSSRSVDCLFSKSPHPSRRCRSGDECDMTLSAKTLGACSVHYKVDRGGVIRCRKHKISAIDVATWRLRADPL